MNKYGLMMITGIIIMFISLSIFTYIEISDKDYYTIYFAIRHLTASLLEQ